MLHQNDKALKEWAVICEALRDGRQIVLLRKGGIREEDGVFTVNDPEFFLMPTYDHQDKRLLKDPYRHILDGSVQTDLNLISIDTYAVVDTVGTVESEEQIRPFDDELPWNEEYVRMRFDFNPYDPLYLLVLRVYRMPKATTIQMKAEYGGCRSWVSMDKPISTEGAATAVDESEFAVRRAKVVKHITPLRPAVLA